MIRYRLEKEDTNWKLDMDRCLKTNTSTTDTYDFTFDSLSH